MLRVVTLACTFLLFHASLFSQKAPIKFGKISDEELNMTIYEADTSASAVILCDYGQFKGDEFKFVRNTRIKILKNSGLHYGSITYVTGGAPGIRGITYNIVDGEVVKEKLKRSDVLTEKLRTGTFEVNIPMPNVKVGSIVEFEIVFDGLPLEWRFQDYIPVKYSELRLIQSTYVKFNRNFYGYEPLDFQDGIRFIATDMPAFKREAYITSADNYITRFEFEVEEINIPGYLFETYASSWEAVNSTLINNQYFGGALELGICLNSIAKDINAATSDPEERIKLAFESMKQIKWNEEVRLYTTNSGFCPALKDKVGNSADINLGLVLLLKKLDIDATPVALSTRAHGMLPTFKPSVDKLNYVIASAKIGDRILLLDATEMYMPYYLLPKRCLNYQGRLISKDQPDWISLEPKKSAKTVSLYNLTLSEDMKISGILQKQMSDYSAFETRKEYHEANSEAEYINSFMEEIPGLRVSKYETKDLEDIYSPLIETIEFSSEGYAESFDDEIILSPLFFEKIEENPFKLEKRKYPVDFGYCFDNSATILIKIPDEYELIEVPKPLILKTMDNGISCLYNVSASGSLITINLKYKINKPIFLEDEYELLKEINNQIIKKHAEPIILKKKL